MVALQSQSQRNDAPVPGARVLIVDDWLETGSQLRAARRLLERAGAQVVGVAVVVDQS